MTRQNPKVKWKSRGNPLMMRLMKSGEVENAKSAFR